MKNFTRQIVRLSVVCTFGLFITFLAGCEVQRWIGYNQIADSGQSGTAAGEHNVPQESPPLPGAQATFQLPPPWEKKEKSGYLGGALNEQPKDSAAPTVLLEFSAQKPGTAADAKALAEEYLKEQQENNPEDQITFSERTVAERNVYIIEHHTDSYWGDYWWATTIYFEKQGVVVSVFLGDRLQNQESAIQTLLQTLEWK